MNQPEPIAIPVAQFPISIDRKRLHCCGMVDVVVIAQGNHRAQHAVLDPSESSEILQQYESIAAWHEQK